VNSDDKLLSSLRAALERTPDDTALRLHYAELLLAAGRADDAVQEAAHVLRDEPGSSEARALMARAFAPTGPEPAEGESEPEPESDEFDWDAAASQLDDVLPPMFVEGQEGDDGAADVWDVERVDVKLDDVGGLVEVKERLQLAFLGPLQNPELRRLYGKSLRGGLLLYGPPGCGKSYLARALAGELGAGLISVSIHDVLDMWVGRSERNLHEIFESARRNAPCVIFFDEIDALGRRRSQLSSDAMRTTVNQLLAELDGAESGNEGIFVLAATNHPWDVDTALRRPGRFDRMVLVLPPDLPAREAIFRSNLVDRPIESIDVGRLARATEGYSGADIAHVCETAAERALIDAVRTGTPRMVTMSDLEAALKEVRPSTTAWFDTAENVVNFANADGTYDDLLLHMKSRRRR